MGLDLLSIDFFFFMKKKKKRLVGAVIVSAHLNPVIHGVGYIWIVMRRTHNSWTHRCDESQGFPSIKSLPQMAVVRFELLYM
jgi:hypothetical protein